MPLNIIRQDITKMKVDAIVNASNTELEMGGGVSGAIFAAAGMEKLKAACNKIGRCDPGNAVITKGFDLDAKYIIHTVGPVWQGGNAGEKSLLKSCYTSSLQLAVQYRCQSIAFPLIASGVYGYPKDQALDDAVSAIRDFLKQYEMMVYLVVYDKKSFMLGESKFSAIARYIDDKYVAEHHFSRIERHMRTYDDAEEQSVQAPSFFAKSMPAPVAGKRKLEDIIQNLDETFSQMLLRLIDEKGYTDVEVYKRANIDRKLFSKIRSDKGYNPSKQTAIAFAISLKLSLDETRDLLSKAGYALSRSNKFDVIIEYFVEEEIFDIFEINQALFAFDQVLLGV